MSEGIARLLDIMARLRDPQTGCPWDVQQTFATIAPYTIEEAYEVAEAIDRDDMDDLRDELGDLLLQVVFHSRMAEEAGHFAFADVVAAICEKMLRRHPHVFVADPSNRLDSAQAQTVAWNEHKRREREARGEAADASVLAGIAHGMPEWQRALKLQQRAATVGFDWPDIEPVFEKLHEELDEVHAELQARASTDAGALSTANHPRIEDEIGDVLFVCANLARHAKVDPGTALRHANAKFERRFRRMELLAQADGASLASLSLDAQNGYWNRTKAEEKS